MADGDGDSGQQAGQLDAQIKVQMGYLLSLPQDYEKKSKWPLLLFLHGAGERGDDLQLVQVHGPPKLIAAGKQFPFIVLSPQCPDGQWWQSLELTALLDEIVGKHKVDEDRVYVTGLSMGGYGVWDLAAHAPRRFAAIAPICGGGTPYRTRDISHLPVWTFHGAKDEAVTIDQTEEMVDALKQRGGNVKFTIYPKAGHDSWTETYNNPELYQWLLSQKRRKK